MFKIKPNQKQLNKYFTNANLLNNIPKKWKDFAPLTRIKSGKGFTQFTPWDYQLEIERLIQTHSYLLIAKGRQLGASETVISICLHQALLTAGKSCLIISKTATDTFALAKRSRDMIQSLNLKLVYDSLSEMKFDNGSVLYFRSGADAGRGLPSCEFIVFDEFAFYQGSNDEMSWSSALPSTEMLDGAEKVIIISTPNGNQNLFYKFLIENNGNVNALEFIDEVRNGKRPGFSYWIDDTGWCKCALHWRSHPLYSKRTNYLEWVAIKKKISRSKLLREYDIDFSSGERSWLDEELIYACATGKLQEPLINEDGEITANYLISIDPAGKGRDYLCCLILLEIDNFLEVVAMHRGRRSGFDRHLSKIGELIQTYKPIKGIIETNSMGILYSDKLTTDYPNVQWENINTGSNNRELILDRLAVKIEQKRIKYPSGIISEELENLERNDNGKIEAARGQHDDACFALAFACYLSSLQIPKPKSTFEGLYFK